MTWQRTHDQTNGYAIASYMKRPPDLVPLLVLALLAAVMVGGYYVFPLFFGVIHRTDCVASGRTDCG